MSNVYLIPLLITSICITGCSHEVPPPYSSALNIRDTSGPDLSRPCYRGGLLLSDFNSLAEFKAVVHIEYLNDGIGASADTVGHKSVRLVHMCDGERVTSLLEEGISEGDFLKAKRGNVWTKMGTAFVSPFAVWHMRDLKTIESLGRRRPWEFGKGDVAFYDLAASMVMHIVPEDKARMSAGELGDKGYLNSFNHIAAQAFMTSIFSEDVADFVADVHERHNMPELITGKFKPEQLADLESGPVDNYLDMINNEWGQELGKVLRQKYRISTGTIWTPQLMANYLNDIQLYQGWVFQVGFSPFTPEDEVVIRFSAKINTVLKH